MRFILVAPAVLLTLLASPSASALKAQEEIARWSFEQTDDARGNVRISSQRVPGAKAEYSDDVPGAYVYDPISKTSRANQFSGQFHGSDRKSDAVVADVRSVLLPNQSLTIEAFVKPSQTAGGNSWLVGKSRSQDDGAELALQYVYLSNANQTWHGAEVSTRSGQSNRFPVGHYSSSTRLDSDVFAWRHVAVTYEAQTKQVTAWVDYHLSSSLTLESPLSWDEGQFLIGGLADHWGTTSLIDEVRVVGRALKPSEFQRARADEIQKVSFVSDQTIVPRDAGCFDVKEHFGAAGDGHTDDTDAFNAAFAQLTNRVPLAYNTLIIPPGEYLISGTLYCSRFIDVKGAGPDKSILRLKDGTFTDAITPEPVLRMSSTNGAPGSHDWVNGSSISLYLDGLCINTGRNNHGAKALEYHSNNLGRLENVVLQSEDGAGVLALDLTHHDVGPALVKNVRIRGFRTGVAIRYQEYSMTFENLTLEGQSVVGFRNEGNIVAIRGLQSHNTVPALICEGANSMAVLLDSTLTGGNRQSSAIYSDGGLYCRNVQTEGYSGAISKRVLKSQEPQEWNEQTIAGPNIDEFIGDKIIAGHGNVSGALKLPVEATPDPPLPPVAEWVNVLNFMDRKHGDDFSPVIQAAVDSGAKVVYIPSNLRLTLRTPIRLHGPLERLVGFGGNFHWPEDVWKGQGQREQTDFENAPPAILIYDEQDPSHTLVLDRLECVHLQHASKATLVLRSSSPNRYTTAIDGGRLFGEDIGGADWHFDHPQHVWVRQWNPESHASGPCIHSKGAIIWALGFKTEYESQKLLAEAGAATEILGGFIYPIGEIPDNRPVFENRDSRMSLNYGASIYHSNHKVHIRDTHGSQTKDFGGESLNWAGSRARVDLFHSSP